MSPSTSKPGSNRQSPSWRFWLATAAVQYLIACAALAGVDACAQYGFAQKPLELLVSPAPAWIVGALLWLLFMPAWVASLLTHPGMPNPWPTAGFLAVIVVLPATLAATWAWLHHRESAGLMPAWRWLKPGVLFALLVVLNVQFVIGFCASASA